MITSGVIAVLALIIVVMSFNPGWMAKTFDIVLKLIVGLVVLCFVGVAYKLFSAGQVEWANVFAGFIPDFSQWTTAAPEIEKLLDTMPTAQQDFWKEQIVGTAGQHDWRDGDCGRT